MKTIIRNLDIVLLWSLLIADIENVIKILSFSNQVELSDVFFNMWFMLLIFVFYRRLLGKKTLNYFLYSLGLKSKYENDD